MFGETNSLDGTNNDNRFLKKQLKVKKAFYFYILFSNVDETNGFEVCKTEIGGRRRKVSTRVQDVPIKDTRAVTRPRTRQLHTRRTVRGSAGETLVDSQVRDLQVWKSHGSLAGKPPPRITSI